ncbi:hypothetical protein HDE_04832 [Halotydeus destructor]|nr:hypothetical protein HDE_04832 [Halotydeus destructor]
MPKRKRASPSSKSAIAHRLRSGQHTRATCRPDESLDDMDKQTTPIEYVHDLPHPYTEEKHGTLLSSADNYSRDPAVDIAHNLYAGIQGSGPHTRSTCGPDEHAVVAPEYHSPKSSPSLPRRHHIPGTASTMKPLTMAADHSGPLQPTVHFSDVVDEVVIEDNDMGFQEDLRG